VCAVILNNVRVNTLINNRHIQYHGIMIVPR
jgi:hypothetical protein